MRLVLVSLTVFLLHLVTPITHPALAGDMQTCETGPLLLTASLQYDETSKDSNWQRYTIKIDQDQMLLSKEFGGFNAPENEHLSKRMTADVTKKIRAFIKSNGLDGQIHEEQPTSGPGVAGYLHLEILGCSPSTIHISGKTQIWGNNASAGSTGETNITHIRQINKANVFFNYLWRL